MDTTIESEWMEAVNQAVEDLGDKLATIKGLPKKLANITVTCQLDDGSVLECNSEIESN